MTSHSPLHLFALSMVAAVVSLTTAAPGARAQNVPTLDQTALDAQAAADQQTALENMSESDRADWERNALLQWLDEELYYHILFRADDVEALRGRIESMSPTALNEYYRQTERLRELMHTQEWQIVNRFYSYYKSIDPFLTPQQQELLARGPATLPPQTIMRVMNALVDQYLRQQANNRASQLQRESVLATRSNFIADQDRMRRYALERTGGRNVGDYFAASRTGTGVIRRDQYRVPGPLITSRQMASLVVWRNLWVW